MLVSAAHRPNNRTCLRNQVQVGVCGECAGCGGCLAASHMACTVFEVIKKRFYKINIHTQWGSGIFFPCACFAVQLHNLAVLAEAAAVACIQIAFCQHTINRDNGMFCCFHMVIWIRGDGLIVKNGSTVYQHTRRHKPPVKEQAMFCRYQHILVRRTVCQSIF
ncbi:hypothetical protein NBRC3188_0356 [Acetobacter pasteurianus NBRC 3188]|uniref:Uncharacterized protein n=1 Tax=Acetobacter pasteurianus NBRC 3188 TaxID=1226663 RepID=A0A401WQQ6_ACEPA|nr:hypothetical protein NBRC3188_0356 [Acetobacter pasteurianus NBRC 3188]